jgi:hypothetical protein
MTTSIYPYTFDSISRIGNDSVGIDQRNLQNINNANHQLENFQAVMPMNKAMDFALNQPNVFYSGNHEGGFKGSVIEDNNELKYTHISRPACKLNLVSRPFATVPYLGRGVGDPDEEFKLRTGQNDLNKKTTNHTMEQDFSTHHNYPLIEPLQNSITNPAYLIEDEAMKGWVRGGLSAREYARANSKQ